MSQDWFRVKKRLTPRIPHTKAKIVVFVPSVGVVSRIKEELCQMTTYFNILFTVKHRLTTWDAAMQR